MPMQEDDVVVTTTVQGSPGFHLQARRSMLEQNVHRQKRPRTNATPGLGGGSSSAPVVVDLTQDAPTPADDDEIQIVGEVRRPMARVAHPVRLRIPSTMRRQDLPQLGTFGDSSLVAHRLVEAALAARPQQPQQGQLPPVPWHPAIPPAPPSPERGFKCPICLERKDDVSSTSCGHVFCTSCIKEALRVKRQCPKCRKALTVKQVHKLFLDE